MARRLLLAWLLCCCAWMAHATEARPLADDPALEARVLDIAAELRCLVCQNETIAASHAALAVDLRKQIAHQLAAGQSPQQIREFMVERYGEFVLYRPAFNATTALLWIGPFLLFVGAFVFLWGTLRRRTHDAPAAELDPSDRLRVRRLLEQGNAPP